MSFVLWLGGKKRILPYLNDLIWDYLMIESGEITYVEPFIGSGIVLINLLENCTRKFKRYLCSDINQSFYYTTNYHI